MSASVGRTIIVDEIDYPEVLGALAIAAQVHRTCGNVVESNHFGGLIAKFTEMWVRSAPACTCGSLDRFSHLDSCEVAR